MTPHWARYNVSASSGALPISEARRLPALSAAGAKGPGAEPGSVAEAEPVVHLTREQIANLAEAIDTMIDSPIRMERLVPPSH